MALFANLKSDDLEKATDSLGGKQIFPTDAYPSKIKVAYAGRSDGGAQSITFVLGMSDGKEYRETVYVTNKKGENYFLNKNDLSKKVPLPGIVIADHICMVATGMPLCEQETEDKVLKVWDNVAKAEVPTTVPVLVGLLNQDIVVGIQQSISFVSKKNEAGEYVDTDETRQENNIEKVFAADGTFRTVPEALNGEEEGTFYAKWLDKNKGQVRDKTKNTKATGAGTKPTPSAGVSAAPKKSLFGAKK